MINVPIINNRLFIWYHICHSWKNTIIFIFTSFIHSGILVLIIRLIILY